MAVTVADVLALNPEWSGVQDAALSPFLADAQLVVTEELAETDLSAARQDTITKWLAAHLYAVADGSGDLVSDRTLDVEQKFGGRYGMALEATRYGKQVLLLDASGRLSAMGSGRAQFRVV